MPYRPTIVTRNSAQCLDCEDIIESRHRHDFKFCSCGNIAVDGGYDYCRMLYKNSNWIDLSETHEGEERNWSWEDEDD